MSTHNHVTEGLRPMPSPATMTTFFDACKYAAVGLIVGCLVVAMGHTHVQGSRVGAVATTGTVAAGR